MENIEEIGEIEDYKINHFAIHLWNKFFLEGGYDISDKVENAGILLLD